MGDRDELDRILSMKPEYEAVMSEETSEIIELLTGMKFGDEKGGREMVCKAWIDQREYGKAEGKAEDVLDLLSDIGAVRESLREKIFAEKDMDRLRRWLRLAARTDSVDAFEKAMMEV